MLIESLLAENFRKYETLEIKDLPVQGAITVSGANESGKTSIGEAICFALFGRTFFLDERNITKLVYWGEDKAEVTLIFDAGTHGKFELYRSVNKEGAIKAKLSKVSSKNDHSKFIEDLSDIRRALNKVIGFDYDAFANSFYLVQRELTSPEPQSETIKKMAGIGDYARISDELLISTHENEAKIQTTEPEAIKAEASLNEINLDESWLPDLVDADQTLETEGMSRQSLVAQLVEKEERHSRNAKSYFGARKSRGFFGFLAFLLFPLFVVSLLLWVVLKYNPQVLDEPIISLFGLDELASVQGVLGQWLLPVAIISGIGFLISLLIKKKSVTIMRELDEDAKDFADSLAQSQATVTADIEILIPERVASLMVKSKVDASSLIDIPSAEQFNNLEKLTENTVGYEASPEELSSAVSRLTDNFGKQQEEIKQLAGSLSVDIEKEKSRSKDAGILRSTLKSLNGVIRGCHATIKINQTATSMLQRAGEDSINLFNKNITTSSAESLPKFTEGRYSEVRIAEDFSVQVYSDRKKDYMDFDEISSGTQRQVMLALRLAMSEELARNTGNEQQFIFLDEPFAFFDPARTRATLKSLPDVSDVISQVWIVAQEFPDVEVDKAIVCTTENTTLAV